jgi:hypothetical protein
VIIGISDGEMFPTLGEAVMANIQLSQTLIGREVERLFSETTASHGEVYENPALGTHFVYGLDPIEPQKEAACRALVAREWFAINAPADAQPLPFRCDRKARGATQPAGAGRSASELVGIGARLSRAREGSEHEQRGI